MRFIETWLHLKLEQKLAGLCMFMNQNIKFLNKPYFLPFQIKMDLDLKI